MIMKSDVLPFSNSTKTGDSGKAEWSNDLVRTKSDLNTDWRSGDPGRVTGDISGAQVIIDLVKNGMGSTLAVNPITLYGQVEIWVDLGLL